MIDHKKAATGAGNEAILVDSISFVTAEDKGAIIVCASHGGTSSGEYASKFPLSLVILNDAGVGKNQAGVQALGILESRGIGACTVSHESARIGDVIDQWENGIISNVNTQSESAISVGMTVHTAIDAWSNRINPTDA